MVSREGAIIYQDVTDSGVPFINRPLLYKRGEGDGVGGTGGG